MSVEKMSLVTIIGPIEQFDQVVQNDLKAFEFHPEYTLQVLEDIKDLLPFQVNSPYTKALKAVCDFIDISGITYQYRDFSSLSDSVEQITDHANSLYEELLKRKQEIDRLSAQLNECRNIIIQLEHIKDANVELNDLFNFKYIKFRFGKMPYDSYERYKLYIDESKNAFFIPTHTQENSVYGMYFTPRVFEESVDSLFSSLHFERIRISGKAHGTPLAAIDELTKEIERISLAIESLRNDIAEFVSARSDYILSCYSKIKFLSDTYDIRKYAAHSEKNFYLIGWVESDQTAKLTGEFATDPVISCVVEAPDVAPDLTPPTKLKNNKLVSPFEEFVGLYALPSYYELDPTPLFAITFLLFFGLMFGDAGQGAILLIGGLILNKKKFNIGKIIALAGCSSVIVGFVYGTVFGIEDILPGFKPLHNANTINTTIIAAIVIGVVVLSLAMILNVVNGVRQKDIKKIFFDPNGIAGIVFYWGIIIAILSLVGISNAVITPLYIIIFVVAPLIVIYLKDILASLISKSQKKQEESLKERLIEGFFELFETLLSYATQTISFLRIGAFALNHAGMMLTVFLIASMTNGSSAIMIRILGNIIVIGLEGLIVGIQVLRLEFYELFSRFFEGNGRAFNPIKINYEKKL